MQFIIRLKQVVDDCDLLKPHHDKGIAGDYDIVAADEEAALDEFHSTVAIACLDDFEVSAEAVRSACTYPACNCIVSTSTSQPVPKCPLGGMQA